MAKAAIYDWRFLVVQKTIEASHVFLAFGRAYPWAELHF
jgi:hypothetical protein